MIDRVRRLREQVESLPEDEDEARQVLRGAVDEIEDMLVQVRGERIGGEHPFCAIVDEAAEWKG